MEFVRVIRFAEFKKKLGASHVLASLIGRAKEEFDFTCKRSQVEGRVNSIFRTSLEVNKPLGLFALSLTNSRGSRVADRGSKVAVAGPMSRQRKMIWGSR